MKKEVVIFLLLVSFIGLSCAASVQLSKTSYAAGDTISGTLDVSFNESADSLFSMNNQSIDLKSFLINNKIIAGMNNYSCSTYNCLPIYKTRYTGSSQSISVRDGQESSFGLYAVGGNVAITNVQFTINSTFGQSNTIPLIIRPANLTEWDFIYPSDNYSRSYDLGCYQNIITSYNYEISNDTMYCEKISIPRTGSLIVGAKIQGTANQQFQMKVLASGTEQSCYFTSSLANPASSCTIQSDFNKGYYFVCIRGIGTGDYKIASSNSNSSCGWAGGKEDYPSAANSTTDYALYAKTPAYAPAKQITIDNTNIAQLSAYADSYVKTNYNRNCSSGCVIPFFVYGINQTLTVSNAAVTYNTPGQLTKNDVIIMDPVSPIISYSGNLSIDKAGFKAQAGNTTLNFYIAGKLLDSEKVSVVSLSGLQQVNPSNPPAGLESEFSVVGGNFSSYQWNFGDNTTITTTTNKAKHTYSLVGPYNLFITATKNNVSTTNNFTIYASSPKDLINSTISFKTNSINNAEADIQALPQWYRQAAESRSNISSYQEEISRINTKYGIALTDEEFADVFKRIYYLNVPYSVAITDESSGPFTSSLEDINAQPVEDYAGGSENDTAQYNNPILQWQQENIEGNISSSKVSETYTDDSTVPLLSLYTLDIRSKYPGESYFVINQQADDLFFTGTASAKSAGNYSIVVLGPKEEAKIEFYIKGAPSLSFFVSPKLSSIPLTAEIAPCNFNKICQPELGENPDNCRSDCFPTGRTVFYICLLLVLALVAYIVMAYWYKTRYENFLFKDSKTLYNLLMFISNAKVSGLDENKIKDLLKKQNWNSEQITYAIKKSKGQRVGLPEIIPFEKISAYFRDKKAKQNINKAPIQNINRW